MARGSKSTGTILLSIERKQAEAIWHLLKPLLDEYYRQQQNQTLSLNSGWPNGDYTIKNLCLSCYQQGLMDAMQLIESGHVTIGEDGKPELHKHGATHE